MLRQKAIRILPLNLNKIKNRFKKRGGCRASSERLGHRDLQAKNSPKRVWTREDPLIDRVLLRIVRPADFHLAVHADLDERRILRIDVVRGDHAELVLVGPGAASIVGRAVTLLRTALARIADLTRAHVAVAADVELALVGAGLVVTIPVDPVIALLEAALEDLAVAARGELALVGAQAVLVVVGSEVTPLTAIFLKDAVPAVGALGLRVVGGGGHIARAVLTLLAFRGRGIVAIFNDHDAAGHEAEEEEGKDFGRAHHWEISTKESLLTRKEKAAGQWPTENCHASYFLSNKK